MCAAMAIDFVGCYVVEKVCKRVFADLEPKPLITRGRERREARRAAEVAALLVAEKEKKEMELAEARAALEKKGR